MRTPGKVSVALAGAFASLLIPASAGALTLGGVTTKSVDDVAARSVTLKAESTLSVLGASVAFQYGPTTAYGLTSASVFSSVVGVKETITVPVTGLAPNTTYHVRAIATSGLDSVLGRDVSFKTKEEKGGGTAPTAPTAPAPTTTTAATTAPSSPGTSGGPGSGSSSSGSGSGSGPGGKGNDDGGSSSPSQGSSPTSPGAAAQASVDPAAAIPPGQATAAITPVLGKTVAIAAVQGTISATGPAGEAVDLSDARAVPPGTVIDARAGTVELTTALAGPDATQTGRFWGARFEVRQSAGDRGLTQIVLRGADFRACKATSAVRRAASGTAAAKRRRPARTLWGSDDHGKFQTRGRGSVATVRGTRWMTQDTCAGTLTRVVEGAVAVRDFGADRTVVVRKGHEYRARVAQ